MLDKSVFTPHGKHLIAGEGIPGDKTFMSNPAHGPAHACSVGTPELVNRACEAAEAAFWFFGYSTLEVRAAFLNAIADEIEARADAIIAIGTSETGLPEARFQGERGRTTFRKATTSTGATMPPSQTVSSCCAPLMIDPQGGINSEHSIRTLHNWMKEASDGPA